MIRKHPLFAFCALASVLMVHSCINTFHAHGAESVSTDDGAVNEYGNICGNLQYHGYVTQQGKAVYIDLDDAIYRYFEGEKPRLLLRGLSKQLNVIGDTLYYCDLARGIFSYNIVSGKRATLSNNDSSFMIATKEYIYYVNQDDNITIYRLKTDGSEDKKFIDISCNSFGIHNGHIYLTEHQDKKPNVVSFSIDTLERKVVAENAEFFTVLGGHVVITDDSTRYVLDQNGMRTPLDSEGYTYFAHDHRWLLNTISVGYLYVVKDGIQKVLVAKPCFNINTTDKKVFYKQYSEEDKKVYSYSINHDGTDMQKLD